MWDCVHSPEEFWSEEQVKKLKELNAKGVSRKETAKILNRSVTAVYQYCSAHGIKLPTKWDKLKYKATDMCIKEYSCYEIAAQLGLSPTYVYRKLGLEGCSPKRPNRIWKKPVRDKLEELILHSNSKSEIAKQIGVIPESLNRQLAKLYGTTKLREIQLILYEEGRMIGDEVEWLK